MARNGARDQGEEALITALLQGKTIPEAAEAAGVSPRTVNRRLADPGFVRQLQAARQRVLTRAVNVLLEGTVGAAVTLRFLATNAEQEAIRLAAARSVLDYALRGVETVDLAEQVRALQAHQESPWSA
jgi:hypothetical protein